ncbi:hypothetical protein GIB67_036401 [Kingdonia uniflora]|uniref:Uncharacterized protein n=1 Tax=Kingdonia uniflora TaxID=39325 RepID=A0A7J7L482_9MAGN|nr:hypothetical protein GIB67_036401 [Kingdonia uniflora]
MSHGDDELEVENVFIGAGCNRVVNNVSWGASGLVAFGAQNAVAICCPNKAQILATLPGHKASVNCTRWIPTTKDIFKGCEGWKSLKFREEFSALIGKNITNISGTFTVDVKFFDVSELQASPKICTCTIGPFQSIKADRAKLKLKVHLNLHGVVSVDSAVLLEEETEVPVEKEPTKETAKMDTDAPLNDESYGTAESGSTMQDASGVDNGDPES